MRLLHSWRSVFLALLLSLIPVVIRRRFCSVILRRQCFPFTSSRPALMKA